MANINRVILTGNLTSDPELSTLPSGTSVCKLRLAVNRRYKDQASGEWVEKPNYFDIKVWGAQGENCANYLSKGRPVAIDGRLEWREWEAQDGSKRQAVEVVADIVQFLGSRDGRRWRRRASARASSPRPSSRPSPCPPSAARRPTTTFHSEEHQLMASKPKRAGPPSVAPAPPVRPAQVLLLLQGQGRGDRLQELQPAPAVRLGEGQDPLAPDHRRLPPAPAPGGGGSEAGPRGGAAALRRELDLRQRTRCLRGFRDPGGFRGDPAHDTMKRGTAA